MTIGDWKAWLQERFKEEAGFMITLFQTYSLELGFPYFSYLILACLLTERSFKECFYWILFAHVKIR